MVKEIDNRGLQCPQPVINTKKSRSGKEIQDEPTGTEEAPGCEESIGPIFLVTRSGLGSGSEELGKVLMRSFVATLKEGPVLPEKMVFLNSGVYLAVSGSQVLEDLLELEKMGVEIFSCGTCLDYYQIKDQLAVGKVTNMFDTVERVLKSARCVTI
jgi:selenium metabolism protein YedF